MIWGKTRSAAPTFSFGYNRINKYIFKDSFTFSLPLAFCTFKKIFDTHSRKHAGPGDIPRKILRKGNVSRNHTIYKISMISESFQSPKFSKILGLWPYQRNFRSKLTFQRIRKFIQFYDWVTEFFPEPTCISCVHDHNLFTMIICDNLFTVTIDWRILRRMKFLSDRWVNTLNSSARWVNTVQHRWKNKLIEHFEQHCWKTFSTIQISTAISETPQFLKPRWDQNLEHVLALTTVTWMNVKWCTCILQTLGRKEIRNWFYQHSSSFKIDKKTPLRRQGRWYQMSDPGRKSLICLSCKLKLHLNLSRIVGIVGGTRGPLLLNIMVMVMIYREA